MNDSKSADQQLSERLKGLMFELGPSRYILMRELFLAAEALEKNQRVKPKYDMCHWFGHKWTDHGPYWGGGWPPCKRCGHGK